MKRLLGVSFFAALAGAALLAVNAFLFLRTPFGTQGQTVVVDKGRSTTSVIEELYQKQIVSNPHFFKAYARLKNATSKIRAGEYAFPAGLTPPQVLDLLLKGDFATRRITIPEGWNVRDVARALTQQGLVDEAKFLAKASDPVFLASLGVAAPSLEGYLFPDTYEIYRPKDEEEVLKKLVARFREVWTSEFEAQVAAKGMDAYQVLILASIVEKETGRAEERPMIASVFANRIARGMPLATDPTIIYGVLAATGTFDGNLTRRHLETPGPYNTYLNPGLPPTPIANPGRAAIQAVISPAMTTYLYFVAKGDGTHQFSSTENEHFEAVRKYQLRQP